MSSRSILLSFWVYLLFMNSTAIAQMNPCGTIMPPEAKEQLRLARQHASLQSQGGGGGQHPMRYLPIKIHIVGDDNGAGYFDAAEAYRLICELNEDYQPSNFYFYVSGDLHYINNTAYYNHDFNDGENMMNQYNVNNVINIYIVENPADNCGYFSWGGDALAVAKLCSGNNSTTLTHELGHYFGLPHTFSGWEGAFENSILTNPIPNNEQERVDGSNCANTADTFCDTPADYLSYRWLCPYNGDLTDPTGTPIEPDQTLYMSYSSDDCQGRFSNEQIGAMHAMLNDYRSELINPAPSHTDTPYSTYIYYPPGGSLVIDPDHILCSWRPIVNADRYLLTLTPSGNLGDKVQIYTTDTFYVANLSANKTYTMKVLPLNNGNTCATPRKITFKTAISNILYVNDLDVNIPNCYNDNTGTITFEAGGGTAPYTYLWSNGTQGNTISNIGSSIYYVTVTDATATSTQIRFLLPQPNAIQADASVTDNTVSIAIDGGLPPFTFNWATGANTNATQNNIPQGTYEMLITDAVGCSTTVNYTITTILSVEQALGNMTIKVLPNLLDNNTDLHINVSGGNLKNAKVSIINTAGQVLLSQNIALLNADNELTIPTNHLTAGLYWLAIDAAEGRSTHKFVVVRK